MPYFIKAENQERGQSEFHGIGGPLSVSDQRIKLPILDAFMNAAEEKGIPKVNDFNKGENYGCGYFYQYILKLKVGPLIMSKN